MRVLTCLAGVWLLIGLAGPAVAEADWPSMMAGPSRTGFEAEDPPPGGAWQTHFEGACGIGQCGLAVHDGLVIIVSSGIVALDAVSGAQVWTNPLPGVAGLPALAGGHVLVAGTRGGQPNVDFVAALDTRTGEVRWKVERPTQVIPLYAGSPVVAKDLVIAPFQDRLIGLELETGEIRWERNEFPRASPATMLEDSAFFGDGAGVVHAIRYDGTVSWNTTIGGDVPGSPVPLGEDVVVANRHGLVSINTVSGEVNWQVDLCEGSSAPPAAAGDTIVHTCDRTVFAFDASGHERWSYAARGRLAPGVAIADGEVLAWDSSGTAAFLDVRTGRETLAIETNLTGAPAAPAWNGQTALLLGRGPAPLLNSLGVVSLTRAGQQNETPWVGAVGTLAILVLAAATRAGAGRERLRRP